MRLTRVHVDAALAQGAEFDLPEAAAAHLSRVLRLQAGDDCVAFNGDGRDYACSIVATGKRTVRVRIGASSQVSRESPLRIVLLQGIARGEKMDLILQKATELGVVQVRPLMSQRSEVKLDADRSARRLAHWRQVVIAACEQSGRAVVPEVLPPIALGSAMQSLSEGELRLTLDPAGTLAFASLGQQVVDRTVVLAVGPEGGWSPLDRQQLQSAGFVGLRLGPRILRTETAALAAISALQAQFGDFV